MIKMAASAPILRVTACRFQLLLRWKDLLHALIKRTYSFLTLFSCNFVGLCRSYDLSFRFSHFPLINARKQAVFISIQWENKLLKIKFDLVCENWFLNNKVLYKLIKLLIFQFLVCNKKVLWFHKIKLFLKFL